VTDSTSIFWSKNDHSCGNRHKNPVGQGQRRRAIS
jgi:hypothetical protein